MTNTYPANANMAHTYIVNGEAFTLDQAKYQEADISVSQLLDAYFSVHPEPKLFALAVDQTFVAKTDYKTTSLSNGASIELFAPIQGG